MQSDVEDIGAALKKPLPPLHDRGARNVAMSIHQEGTRQCEPLI